MRKTKYVELDLVDLTIEIKEGPLDHVLSLLGKQNGKLRLLTFEEAMSAIQNMKYSAQEKHKEISKEIDKLSKVYESLSYLKLEEETNVSDSESAK